MKSRIDERVAAQLHQVSSMEYVMDWLSARLEDRRDETVSLSGENLLRAQGRAREIAELLSEIRNSQDTLKKLRK